MKFNYRFIYLAFLFLIINSCEKNELENNNPNIEIYKQLKKSVNEHFFDYNYVTSFNFTLEEIYLRNLNPNENQDNELKSATDLYSPFIQEIREFYRANSNKQKHIEKKYGFPMWDRLVEVKLDDGDLAVIPVAHEKSINIEAIIYVFKNESGKLKFHYAERGKFNSYPKVSEKVNGKKYPDREFVISQFLYFDKVVFEYVDCEILSEYKELLGLNDEALKSASSTECTVTVEETTYDYYYAVYVGSTLAKLTYNYSEVVYYVEYFCSGTVDIPTGGGGGSSGGGGDSDPTDLELENQEQEAKEEICNTYNGIIDISSLENQAPNFSPQQEQFIISLANVAALYELGFTLDDIQADLVNYRADSDFYTKYNKLNTPETYITSWDSVPNSSPNSDIAFISPPIGNSEFQLKYYPEKNGKYNALGLVKNNLPGHAIEWALELLDGYLRDHYNMADDFIYDMHLFNALNFMEYYCND